MFFLFVPLPSSHFIQLSCCHTLFPFVKETSAPVSAPLSSAMLWLQYNYLQHFISCTILSLTLTLFYKRNFQAQMFPLVAFLLLLHIVVQNGQTAHPFTVLATVACAVHSASKIRYHISTLASLRMWTFAINFLAIADLLRGVHRSAVPNSLKILLFSIPQFARYPPSVKHFFRSSRAILGPLYVLHTIIYAAQGFPTACKSNTLVSFHRTVGMSFIGEEQTEFCDVANAFDVFHNATQETKLHPPSQELFCSIAAWSRLLCAVSASVAGVVFRPDNRAVLEVFRISIQFKRLRVLHRLTMTGSFVFFCFSKYLEATM